MANKTVLEVLQGALKLLRAKTRWTQGAMGKSKQAIGYQTFNEIEVCTEPAVCFCAMGALHKANDCVSSTSTVDEAASALAAQIPKRDRSVFGYGALTGSNVINWNDNPRRTHAQVVALFRKAIAAQKAAA